MSKCNITFEQNSLGVYFAGQTVSGTAELITIRPKTIRSIYISVSGYAEVRWTENITKQDTHGKPQKTIETYSGSELYYSNEKYVYGQSGGPQMELSAGRYVFPFQAIIPPNAPTSFNGSYGKIQHEVSLVVDRVMRYNNTFKQPYSVISPYDLNLNPEKAKPIHKIDEKTIWWSMCCGRNGPLVMDVTVPFSAYAPGQKIRFDLILDNQSEANCTDVKVRLMKRTVFTSRSPEVKTQVVDVKVADNHCGDVNKLNKAEFHEFLQIPSTTPTSLTNCGLIKVSYTLKFIAKVRRFNGTDLCIEFPFTIGTVPLYASIAAESNASTSNGAPHKPLSPATYEEDIRSEQFESNTFKPRYPVFLFDTGLNSPKNSPSKNLYPTSLISTSTTNTTSTQQNHYPVPTAPSPQHPSSILHNTSRNEDAPLEVLGFSIPPGYQPTPNNPQKTGNIGWK